MQRSWKVPKGLGKHGSALYRDVGPLLLREGSLKRVDKPSFHLMCQCFDMMADSFEKMSRSGTVVKDERGSIKKHPLFQIWKDSRDGYLRLAERFGLSPKARAEKIRFSTENKKGVNEDEEKFFAG